MDILTILGNIGFDWRVAVANFVNFLVIFYLLKRFAFGPIQNVLNERRQKIEQGLEDARRAETELVMAKEQYDREVGIGQKEANTILARAYTQEDSILKKATAQAEQEATHRLREAREQIEKERAYMEDEIQEKTASLVISGVEKIMRVEMSQEKNEELMAKHLLNNASS